MNINEYIKHEYDELSKEYIVYGVFLYGSQNYGLNVPSSDIDTKAIVIPTFSDLVHRKPVSKVRDFACGECDIKDIREMIASYKKQNVNFIETLFTKYFYVNPEFEEMHKELIEKREEIAHFDEHKTLDCFNGLMKQAKKRLVREGGYNKKALMNMYKYKAMTEKYINGKDYPTILNNPEFVVYRTKAVENPDERAAFLDKEVMRLIKQYDPKPKNELLGKWLDQWIERVIAHKVLIKWQK